MKLGNKGNIDLGAGPAVPVRDARALALGNRRSRPSTGLLVAASQERRVPLRGPLTKRISSCCVARILVLAAEDTARPIITYIESVGGVPFESLAVISTMNGIRCPIVTFCRGTVGWPVAAIAAHGLRGFRTAAPGTRFSFKDTNLQNHPRTAADADSSLSLLAGIIAADARKQPFEILQWLKDGAQFSAQEAIQHGLIDLVAPAPVVPPSP